MKGLWNHATDDEREQAKLYALKIMETWMGLTSKSKAAESLKIPLIRYWQIHNQAIAGMLAGLLTQPRTRKKPLGSEASELLLLKKKVTELEAIVKTQDQVIQFLRSIPGSQSKGHTDVAKQNSSIPKGRTRSNRVKSIWGPKGPPTNNGESIASEPTNTQKLEN